MFTVCPECEAVFRVGAQHLQVAGGSVRCGKCEHTFNALLYLTEDPPAPGGAIPASIMVNAPADQEPHKSTAAKAEPPAEEQAPEDKSPEQEAAPSEAEQQDEITEEEATSTATGFAARIRRFLEASDKEPEPKKDDTPAAADEEDADDEIQAESSEDSRPVLTLVDGSSAADDVPATDAAIDAASDEVSGEQLVEEPDANAAVVTELDSEAADAAQATEPEAEAKDDAAMPEEPVLDDVLDVELETAEVVEDVDEFEAAVLATISEVELSESGKHEALASEQEQAEEVTDESGQAAEPDLEELAEHVIDSMPDVVVEGAPGDKDGEDGDDEFVSTADRIKTLEMLSDKEAETYFGEMLVDRDALEAAAKESGIDMSDDDGIAADEADDTDEPADEVADAEELVTEDKDDEAQDEVPQDDEPEEVAEEALDADDEDEDDSEWRLVAEKEAADDDSPDPVLFIDEDATDESKKAEESDATEEADETETSDDADDADDNADEDEEDLEKQESLEFNVPVDQLDSVFTEAQEAPLAASDDDNDARDGAVDSDSESDADDETEAEADTEIDEVQAKVEQLAASPTLAVENIELSAEDEAPRHDISDSYKPPPAPTPSSNFADRISWWMVAGVVLAVFLTAQLIHFNRYSLSNSFVGGALRTIYGDLDSSAQPEWDVSQYDIQRSTGVGSSNNTGTLTIVGRLTNGADFAQPYPVLRLMLLDRWGDQIGVRNLRAQHYLAQDQRGAMMEPFENASIEISIIDPEGEPASNFVIEICLPNGQGGLNCR